MAEKKSEEINEEEVEYLGPPYVLHEIDCICENPQYQFMAHASPDYRFEIFQLVDDLGNPIEAVFQCDNCGRKWVAKDIGEYELLDNDASPSYEEREIDNKLPGELLKVFNEVEAGPAKKAWALWVLENAHWGDSLPIAIRDDHTDDDHLVYKQVTINGFGDYDIKDMTASKGIISF